MKSKGIKVCMISCTHGLEDDRIYWKECQTLAKEGYEVVHIAVGNESIAYTCPAGIRLIQLKKIATTLFSRYQFYSTILKTAALQQAAVYHFHDWQLNIIGPALKKLPWKPKVIYDAHESTQLLLEQDVVDKQLSGLKKAYYKIKARQASKWEKKKALAYDAIITAEEYVLSTFFAKEGQFQKVIHNYSYFLPTNPPSSIEKKYDVVYAGLMAPNRGIMELIAAMAICKEKNAPTHLLLMGTFYDVAFEQQVKAFITDNHLDNVITLLPTVAYSEVPHYLQQSKIGACTWHLTNKNKQAIPIKLFEYMAYGLPILFSHHCYASKYVKNTNCGLLVNPHSPADIAQGILSLLNNAEKFSAFSTNGKKAVEGDYNWVKESVQLIQLYQQMLEN
jgi:glycosyltransferase involved in cell wall biosynthesis